MNQAAIAQLIKESLSKRVKKQIEQASDIAELNKHVELVWLPIKKELRRMLERQEACSECHETFGVVTDYMIRIFTPSGHVWACVDCVKSCSKCNDNYTEHEDWNNCDHIEEEDEEEQGPLLVVDTPPTPSLSLEKEEEEPEHKKQKLV